MASIATENIKLGEQKRAQEEHEKQVRLSGEQEEHRRREAQNILKLLQVAVTEKEIPGTEGITDACLKAEELLIKQAQSPSIDPETRKLLEDIAQLAGTVKQTVRHNDLGDRLNRIAEELKKAVAQANTAHLPSASTEASKRAIAFVEAWRPLFMLFAKDKDFRLLLIDTLKISRRIYGRHTEGLGTYAEQKFVEGRNPVDIAKQVGGEVKESAKNPSGEFVITFTETEWNTLQDDLFKVLSKIASHPDYREGVERMFELLELVRSEYKHTVLDKKAASAEIHARQARMETQELIASFAGRETFYKWNDSLKDIIYKVEHDERSKQYLEEVKQFILSTKSAELVSQEDYKAKSKELVNRGRELIKEYKYSQEIDEFLNRSEQLLENIRNDETLAVLRHHAGIVASDISIVNKEGAVQLDMDLIGRFRDVVMPLLAESIKYIPLPRIEDCDEKREYWVDNIVLCGYDVIPENVRFQIETDSKLNIREAKTKHSDTRLVITFSKIRTEFKDLEFFYHRKSFPEITEQGRAHVRLGGNGATLKLVFAIYQDSNDKVPKLQDGHADFHISKMDIEYEKKTLTHDVLVPLMTNMWNQQIQTKIEHAVEKNLTKFINSVSDKLTEVLIQVNRPLSTGMDTFKDIFGTKEFAQAYQNRMQKLE